MILAAVLATALAVDPAKSKAQFSVQHVFVSRVTGTIAITGDRDGALTSPDFFDVKEFPQWTFTSATITPVNATSFGVDGTIVIRGVTQTEHLDVTIKGDAAHPVYHAVGHLDRKAFKMPVTRLDPVIGATVDITLDVTTK